MLLCGALLLGQASAGAPAFAQTFHASPKGAPIVGTVAVGNPAALPATPGLGLRTSPTLGRGAVLTSVATVRSAALVLQPLQQRVTSRSSPLASADGGLAEANAAPRKGGAEGAAASLARAQDGLSPRADNAPFLSAFWTGAGRTRPTAGDGVEAPVSETQAARLEPHRPAVKPSRAEPTAPRGSALLYNAVAAPVLLAAPGLKDTFHKVGRVLSDAQAIPWVHQSLPYAIALVVLALAKPAARFARRLADKLADRAGWDGGTRLLARHAAGWATWIAAGLVASQVAGVEPITVAKSLGITTLAMSLALKGFLGNFIQGVALLLSHPFDIGDKVKVGKTEYKVVAMTLREVILTKDDGETHMHMSYSSLGELPITIFKPYVMGRSFLQLHRPDLTPPSIPRGRKWLPMAGIAALGLGMAYPGAAFVHPWLVQTIPWLYALGVAVATFFAARYAPKAIDRVASAREWGSNERMVGRLAASGGVFLLGVAAALRIVGVSWEALAASAGVTGIIVTIAATELIQSALASLTLLGAQPFTLGDRIKVGDDHQGTVVDITLRYVVIKLDGEHEAYTLLPVSLFSKFEAPGPERPGV